MNAIMTDVETEARMREILGDGWRAPHDEGLLAHLAAMREDDPTLAWIAKRGPFWQVVGTGPDGRIHSSADEDPIVLAERLAKIAQPVNVMSMASLAEQQAIAETEALFAEGEAGYGGEHEEAIEDHGEAGGEEASAASDDVGLRDAGDFDLRHGDGADLSGGGLAEDLEQDYFDLGELEDYTLDPPALEGAEPTDADFSEPDGPAGQFIFGDNLYQMRVAAIGLVTVKAASIMPAVDLVRIAELRNFTLGVSEKRWDDDPAKREELDTLEATARLANAIAKARDDKAAYLLDASREQVEAFDVEADWP